MKHKTFFVIVLTTILCLFIPWSPSAWGPNGIDPGKAQLYSWGLPFY